MKGKRQQPQQWQELQQQLRIANYGWGIAHEVNMQKAPWAGLLFLILHLCAQCPLTKTGLRTPIITYTLGIRNHSVRGAPEGTASLCSQTNGRPHDK